MVSMRKTGKLLQPVHTAQDRGSGGGKACCSLLQLALHASFDGTAGLASCCLLLTASADAGCPLPAGVVVHHSTQQRARHARAHRAYSRGRLAEQLRRLHPHGAGCRVWRHVLPCRKWPHMHLSACSLLAIAPSNCCEPCTAELSAACVWPADSAHGGGYGADVPWSQAGPTVTPVPQLARGECVRLFASLHMCGSSSGLFSGLFMPAARQCRGLWCACNRLCWETRTIHQFAWWAEPHRLSDTMSRDLQGGDCHGDELQRQVVKERRGTVSNTTMPGCAGLVTLLEEPLCRGSGGCPATVLRSSGPIATLFCTVREQRADRACWVSCWPSGMPKSTREASMSRASYARTWSDL